MHIAELHVDGFGALERFRLDGLSPGLQLIYGYNEAGKSTLTAFVRAMLFGLPDRRARGNLYEPLGGRQGGRLVLVAMGERYVIERHAGKNGFRFLRADGSDGTEADLQALLGHATRDLYQNVFAFGLGELQTLDSLAADEVRGRIYTAGVGGGGASLAEVEARLEREMQELFSPKGHSQELAKRFLRLDELEAGLREVGAAAADYDTRMRELDAARAGVAGAEARVREFRHEMAHLKSLDAAFPAWATFKECEDRLQALPRVGEFPEDGVERLQRFEAARDAAEETARKAAGRVLELRERQAALTSAAPNDVAVLAHAELVELMRRGRGDYDSKAASLPKREGEREAALAAFAATLRELGPAWTEETLKLVDASVPARDEVRSWKSAVGEREQAVRDAARRFEEASAEAERLGAAAAQAQRLLAETPRPAGPGSAERKAVEARRADVRRLRGVLAARREAELQREGAERAEADLRVQLDSVLLERPATLPKWPLYACATAAALTMFLAGVAAALGRTWWVLGVAGVAFAAFGVFYGEQRRRLRGPAAAARQALLQKLRTRVDEEAGRLAEAQARAETLAAEAQKLGGALDAGGVEDSGALDRLEAEIDTRGRQLDEAERLFSDRRRDAGAARAAAEQAAERKAEAEKEHAAALAYQEVALAGWAAVRARRGLPEALTPDGGLEFLSRAEAARAALQNIEAMRERIGKIEAGMRAYEQRARALLEVCGRAEIEGRTVAASVDALIEEMEAARRRAVDREALAAGLRETEKARVEQGEALARLQGELAELLESGHARDADGFRRRARAAVERKALSEKARSQKTALAGLAGGGEAVERFIEELQAWSREKVEERLAMVEREIEAGERERGEWSERAGALERAVREMETDGRAAALRAEAAVHGEAVARGARRWAALAIAAALIRRAREEYERNRQPEVIQEASRFFARITDSRYRRVIAPPGEDRHEVEEFGTGRRLDSAVLSRGTQEQLYLALRFGLIREVARRSEPLPVVMDDILVNFDPRRARAAAEALGELAESHQILLFTCHPQTVALVKEACPDAVERVLGAPPSHAPAPLPEPPLLPLFDERDAEA